MILVTGAAGFIGSHLLSRLTSLGFDALGVDDLSSGSLDNIPRNVPFMKLDLAEPSAYLSLPSSITTICHLAGQSSGELSFSNPILDLERNTHTTLLLSKYAQENGVHRFILASSMSVYGTVPNSPIREDHSLAPLSCYGVSKLSAERYLNILGRNTSCAILRMFNVYGPGQDMTNMSQGMVSIYLSQAISSQHIVVKGSLDRFRDFIYIDDVIDVWIKLCIHPMPFSLTLNLGNGVKTTVREILGLIKDLHPDTTVEVVGSTPGDQSGIYADTSMLDRLFPDRSRTDLRTGLSLFNDWATSRPCFS